MRFRGTLVTACLGLALLTAAPARAVLPTHEFILGNGLKVVVREDHRAPVAITQLWYKVGSAWEPPGRTGLSHVLEHMMFKGTRHLAPGEFSRLVADYGGRENAFTSRDYTGYYQVLASKHVALAMELEAERMVNLELDEAEFRKEVEVVKEERRLRTEDKPSARFAERFRATAYMASSYGQPVIGWMHDLDRLRLDDLADWYRRWYVPGNAVLVVVGDVQPEAVRQLAQDHFGGLPAGQPPAPPALLEIPAPGARTIELELPARLPELHMAYNVPSLSTATEDWEPYALRMLAGVLDSGYSARIESEVVRGSEVAVRAGVSYDAFARGDSLFWFSGTPNLARGHGLDALETAFQAQVERLQATAPEAAEMERVRAQVVAELVYGQDSLHAQANMIGSLESMDLSWRLVDEYVPRLDAVTAAQVQDVARRYLVRGRLTTGRLHPEAPAAGGAP